MPFTGSDFKTLVDVKSDRAYSNYFDDTKKNIIIQEAINKGIDFKIAENDKIQVQSDLFGIYKSNVTYTPSSNTINLQAGGAGISDYFRLYNLSAKFVLPMNVNVIAASNTTPIRITLSASTNLRTGELVVISGITSNTNANGSRYLKKVSSKIFELYSDINLLNPIAGNGTYSGTAGQISRVIYNFTKNLKPNRKFSVLNEPTVYDPFIEVANNLIKIYPLTSACSEATVDYISTPTYIDVTDNVTDLLLVYSQRFLYFLADETCRLMGLYSRDPELMQGEQAEMIQQP